jgi:hypothetical protein
LLLWLLTVPIHLCAGLLLPALLLVPALLLLRGLPLLLLPALLLPLLLLLLLLQLSALLQHLPGLAAQQQPRCMWCWHGQGVPR